MSYSQAPSLTPRAPQAIYGRPQVAPPLAPVAQVPPMAVPIASVPGMVSPTAYGRASLSNSPSPLQNGFGTPATPTKFLRVGQLA